MIGNNIKLSCVPIACLKCFDEMYGWLLSYYYRLRLKIINISQQFCILYVELKIVHSDFGVYNFV